MALNQIDKDLNDRLLSFTNTLANGNATLRDALREQARRMGVAQDSVIDEYEDYLNKSRSWHGKEAEDAKARLIRLRKLEQDREDALKESTTFTKKYNEELRQLNKRKNELDAKLASSNLSTNKRNNLAKQQQQLIDQINQRKIAGDAELASLRLRVDMGKQAAIERHRFESKELSTTAKWGNTFRHNLTQTANSAITKAFGSISFTAALERAAESAYKTVSAGAQRGAGVSTNPFSDSAISIFGAARLGYKPEEWVEMIGTMKRTIMTSSRGLYEFTDGIKLAESAYSDTIVSAKERTELATKNMELMTNAGIRFRAQDTVAFVNDMSHIKNLTGETYSEFTANINSIIKSESVQAQLKAATSEEERRAMIAGIETQYAQNRAMGLTSEKAKEAATTLAKMAGEKPLDRFKKAARIRAFGAAMGMGDDANRLASLELKGRRRTGDENQEYQRLAGAMSEALTQTGTQSLSAEIFASTLADKLQLEAMLGPSSPFNTTLDRAVQPLAEAAKTLDEFPKKMTEMFSSLNSTYGAVMNNPLSMLALAGGGAYAGKQALGWAKGVITGGPQRTIQSPGSPGGPSAPGPNPRVAPGGASTAAKFAKFGGGALAAGTGIYEGYNEYQQTGKMGRSVGKGIGAAAGGYGGMLAGAAVGQALIPIPVVGALIGGAVGAAGLGAAGSWLGASAGEMFDTDNNPNKADIKYKSNSISSAGDVRKTSEQQKLEDEALLASTETARNTKEQVNKLGTNNELLQLLAESSQRQIELAERQLVAITMSDNERSANANQAKLRRDNKFAAQYGYI